MSELPGPTKTRTTLQTVTRSIGLLEYVANAERPPTIKEVAAALDYNITTCYHLVNTLAELGYLVRNGDGGLLIGARATVLYNGFLRHFSPDRALRDIVDRLSNDTGETAYLSVATDDGVVIQVVVESKQAVRVGGLSVGFLGSEHRRASGKAVLAYLDDAHRERILKRSLSGVPARQRRAVMAEILDELALVRERGWATDNRGFDEGICCAAAPIFVDSGRVFGSLAVSVPADRYDVTEERVIALLLEASEQASQALLMGGRGRRSSVPTQARRPLRT